MIVLPVAETTVIFPLPVAGTVTRPGGPRVSADTLYINDCRQTFATSRRRALELRITDVVPRSRADSR